LKKNDGLQNHQAAAGPFQDLILASTQDELCTMIISVAPPFVKYAGHQILLVKFTENIENDLQNQPTDDGNSQHWCHRVGEYTIIAPFAHIVRTRLNILLKKCLHWDKRK
jgi:hypothetical protein